MAAVVDVDVACDADVVVLNGDLGQCVDRLFQLRDGSRLSVPRLDSERREDGNSRQ